MVEFEVDGDLPRGVSCRMTVHMDTGDVYTSQVDYPKGSIQNPMSDNELRGKFDSLAIPVLGKEKAQAIAEAVANVEQCADVRELMSLLQAS